MSMSGRLQKAIELGQNRIADAPDNHAAWAEQAYPFHRPRKRERRVLDVVRLRSDPLPFVN